MTHPDDLSLQAWHDGELDAGRRAELAAHVESCGACAGKVAALRSLARATQRWVDAAPELPDDFADQLLARLDPPASRPASVAPVAAPGARASGRVVPMRRWFYPALAAAAAAVVALGVGAPRLAGLRGRGALPVPEGPVVVGEGNGGAKVTRVDVPGAESYTVLQLQGARPDTVTAVVWIQEREAGGSR